MNRGPTTSLIRAVLLACGVIVLAVALGRPALTVVAAPFVVWSVLAVIVRPPASEPLLGAELSAREITAGQTVGIRVEAGPGRVVDLAAPPHARLDLEPEWGAVCDVGGAAIKLRPRRWGHLALPDAEVSVTDAWGMWTGHQRLALGELEVSPSSMVPGRGDAIPHPIGMAGIHQSKRAGDGSALADIRRFMPGDRLNRVNWRVTSRTGALHTNATTADRDTDVLLVLDTTVDVTTAELGGPYESSLDGGVAAIASLTEHYLRLGDRVGVHDLGSVIGDLPPRSGIRQYAVLTSRLAKARTEHARGGGVRRVGRLRPGTFVVVCTPLLDPAVLGEIATLSRRGAAVLVVDTLPARIGRLDGRGGEGGGSRLSRLLDPAPTGSFREEAWMLRRIEREADIVRLREVGIPVAPWAGVGGVAALAAALASQRPAARSGGGGAR